MIDKPQDLAIMFGVFALIVVTVGFAVADINDKVTTDHNDTYFTTINSRVTSQEGFKGISDSSGSSLTGEEGSDETPTTDNFILQGIDSLRSLGQSWAIVKTTAEESNSALKLDPIYITVLIGLLIISFAVVIYAYIRGIQP